MQCRTFGRYLEEVHILQSPNSERDSIMPCAVKSSFLNRFTDISLEINHGDSLPVSLLTKAGFHASNRRSLLSEFVLCILSITESFLLVDEGNEALTGSPPFFWQQTTSIQRGNEMTLSGFPNFLSRSWTNSVLLRYFYSCYCDVKYM